MLTYVCWIMLSLFPIVSCQENLPAYSDPSGVLRATFVARYVLAPSANALQVDMVLRNVFDETLEAQAAIQGNGSIALKRNFGIRRSFALTSFDLVHGRYDRSTGLVTLAPGDSLTFRFMWDFVDDIGNNVTVTQFRYHSDPTCAQRRIAYEETLVLEGTMRVFARVEPSKAGPEEFSICYADVYVAPNECPPFDTAKPCTQ